MSLSGEAEASSAGEQLAEEYLAGNSSQTMAVGDQGLVPHRFPVTNRRQFVYIRKYRNALIYEPE
jgi:hypothetical protein